MAIELFWGSGSPFSWRVLLALEVKGQAYESHLIEMSKGEHKTAAFRAMNPRGQVPVLRDGEVIVHQSVAILAYLEKRFPDPPLFGRTPDEAAAIWQSVIECLSYIDEPFEKLILPLYYGQAAEKEEQVKAALPAIRAELDRLEGVLSARSWLASATLSAADLATYPMVRSLVRALAKPDAARFDHRLTPLPERFPGIGAWMTRIEALPGYDRTYPPHWRTK